MFPWVALRLNLKNSFSRKSGVSKSKNSPEIIISLTSMPSRIDKVYITIETLLQQSLKPDRVQLWLAKDEMSIDDLPETLLRQEKRGLEICWIDKSMRSYNKLVPSLEKNPESVIVTADDDVVYPRWWLKIIVDAWRENLDNIVAYRTKIIEKITEDKLAPYSKWSEKSGTFSSLAVFPTGVSGVLYPPGSLSPETLNREVFSELSPSADDVWFKAMSLLNETPCRRVFNKNKKWKNIIGTQEQRLSNTNNKGVPGERPNDIQLRKVFSRYELYDKLK